MESLENREAHLKKFIVANFIKIETTETREDKATAIIDMLRHYFTVVVGKLPETAELDESKKSQA
jgi:hypothetical protein